MKGKPSEIHLSSSEVRGGSKIESSLLYEQPIQSLEEKCADKVNNDSYSVIRETTLFISPRAS